ncbi:MAG: site-specific integrase [Proteobacteria bacterium]|nr:site-specific integrase [Pseudomonadota bacterium]
MKSREDVLRALAPLKQILRVPDDLMGFLPVARRLEPVLASLLTIVDEDQRQLLSDVLDSLGRVLEYPELILNCFPEASGGGRKILKGYYSSHPHYCVFWHACASPELEKQYDALVVSLFAVQMRLDKDREVPAPPSDPAYMVGLSLRQLTDLPDPSVSAFLFNLPLRPLQPQALLIHFDTQLTRLGLKPQVTGPMRNIGYVHRALQWFETGVWEVKGHEQTGKAGTHRAARHGATEHAQPSRSIPRLLAGANDGSGIAATDFVEDDRALRANDRDLEFSPPADAARRGTLVTVPPRSASASNRGDRRGLARNIARYTAQAIALGNQSLPVTHATLSGHELKLLLTLIDDLGGQGWEEVAEADRAAVAAWAASRLFLCRPADATSQLRVVRSGKAANENELDPGRSPTHITWIPARGLVWLPVESPRHVAPVCQGEPAMRTLPIVKSFAVSIPPLLDRALSRLEPVGHKLFQRDYETEFGRVLSAINLARGTALNPERVGRMIARFMAQLGGKDRVYELYFRGMPPNQHNPCVYSAVSVRQLQKLHTEACARMYRLAGRPDLVTERVALQANVVADEETFVGSMHVPTRASVRSTVRVATDTVRRLASSSHSSFAEQHNAYTAYLAFFLLATTGLRAVSSLLPARFDVDGATGLCFVSDKDNDAYEQARIVWLHPTLLRQLDEYRTHVMRLRQYLALTSPQGISQLDGQRRTPPLSRHASPNRTDDLALLDKEGMPTLFLLAAEGGQLTPTFPAELQSLLGDTWQLRLGALRHFVRTELLRRAIPGEAINAALGHGERGEAPWGSLSSLPPIPWRRRLGTAFVQIIADAGFEVLSSPLLRSTGRP